MKRSLLAALTFALALASPARAVLYNISWANTHLEIPSTVAFTGQIDVVDGIVLSGYIDVTGGVTSGVNLGNYAGHYTYIAPTGPVTMVRPLDGYPLMPTYESPVGFWHDGKVLLDNPYVSFLTPLGWVFGAGDRELNFTGYAPFDRGYTLYEWSAGALPKRIGTNEIASLTPVPPGSVPDGGATVLLLGGGLTALAAIRRRRAG